MSRIDRFLVTEDWEGYFNGVVQSTLSRPVSDHFPILLDGGGVRRGSPLGLKICGFRRRDLRNCLSGGGKV